MADWIDEEAARRRHGQTRPLLPSQHDAVNGRYPGATLEECVECGDHTGRAGRSEDSLYCELEDSGPFCSECWQKHVEAHERKDDLAADHFA